MSIVLLNNLNTSPHFWKQAILHLYSEPLKDFFMVEMHYYISQQIFVDAALDLVFHYDSSLSYSTKNLFF